VFFIYKCSIHLPLAYSLPDDPLCCQNSEASIFRVQHRLCSRACVNLDDQLSSATVCRDLKLEGPLTLDRPCAPRWFCHGVIIQHARTKDYCVEVRNLVRLKPLISVIRRPNMECLVKNPPAAGSAIAKSKKHRCACNIRSSPAEIDTQTPEYKRPTKHIKREACQGHCYLMQNGATNRAKQEVCILYSTKSVRLILHGTWKRRYLRTGGIGGDSPPRNLVHPTTRYLETHSTKSSLKTRSPKTAPLYPTDGQILLSVFSECRRGLHRPVPGRSISKRVWIISSPHHSPKPRRNLRGTSIPLHAPPSAIAMGQSSMGLHILGYVVSQN